MKKGVSQVDWIISLALFLLYIVWFFVFVSPQINTRPNIDASMNFLKDYFYDEFKLELVKIPIFIESNYTGNLPVIINNTFGSDRFKILGETVYLSWKDRVFFLANMSSEKETYWILNGGDYSENYTYLGMDAEYNRLSIENMSVEIHNSMLKSATYVNKERIKNADFYINEDAVSITESSFKDFGFAVFYDAEIGNLNHTSFIFNHNTEIYNLISTESESTYKLKIILDLSDYNSYYSDNLYFGNFDYENESKSVAYSHDRITFYSQDSLTIFFDSEATFNLNYYNSSLTAEIEFDIWDDYIYKIEFHKQGNNIEKNKLNVKKGASKQIQGIYLENVTEDYDYLKNKWGFENFYILVYENSTERIDIPSFEIGNYDTERRNVYAETENLVSLDKEGIYKPVSVNYRIW